MDGSSRDADGSGRDAGAGITGPASGQPAARTARAARRRVDSARLEATSPLALASHLVGLARDADHTGLTGLAEQLLALACALLDDPPAAFV